jgi:tetratricopeptide (TPR) repeat protein
MVGVQPPDPLTTRLDDLVSGYWAHIQEGRLAFSAKRYAEAAAAFKKATVVDPGKAGGFINLAAALGQMQQYREAIAQLETAAQLAPDNVTLHFNLGSLYTYLGDHGKAIEHFEKVAAKSPTDAGAQLALADALSKEGRSMEAFEYYKAAVRLKPDLAAGWLNMSALLFSAGQYGEAQQVLEEASVHLPHDRRIAHGLARLLAASPDQARRRGQRALDLALKLFDHSGNAEHARTVALSYAEVGQCPLAVAWIERAIRLATASPKNSSLLSTLERDLDYFKTHHPCRVPPG